MEFNNFNYSPEALLYKPDWPRACERWVAFWERQPIDRPLIDVKAPRPGEHKEIPQPASLEDLYFSPDYIASSAIAMLESTYFGGESVPAPGFLMGGYALGCGEKVKFDPNTVWHPVIIHSMEEPVNWNPGPNDPWRKKLEKVVDRLLSIAPGKFLVGYVGQVPVNDLLFLLRGGQNFLMDLVDNIELCCQRLRETFPLWLENFNYFCKLIDSRQKDGCVRGWPGLWSHYFVETTQSDMSCMISTEMFKKYVMTEMDLLGEKFGRIWYHLDGPGAIRHLPVLLSRPYINVIQYVSGVTKQGIIHHLSAPIVHQSSAPIVHQSSAPIVHQF